MTATEQTVTIDRVLEPLSRCLTPEAARMVMDLRADPQLQARVDMLAERCNEGTLTADEREEYETYVRTSRVIAILQDKVRGRLSDPTSA